jgi:hypothetical protein
MREVSILSGLKLGLEIDVVDGGVVVRWSGDGVCFMCGSGSGRRDLVVFIGWAIEVLWLMVKTTMVIEIAV